MNKDFDKIIDLLKEVKLDKMAEGADSAMLNRYPVRFILFDNFADSKEFVKSLIDLGVTKMQKIVDWMDKDHPDQMLTYTDLANKIWHYIEDNSGSDCIIVPFSELARFYDNNSAKEFDALVGTVKGIQTSIIGFNNHQRVYIPMIGQYGKMSKFFMDSQCIMWHLASSIQSEGYHMILTTSSYGVKELEKEFSVISNITDWLKVWRDDKVRSNIISTSKTIYAFSNNAQPDNAITYTLCTNAYEFLTKGLHLDFGNVVYHKDDEQYWRKLTEEIEYKNFSFEKFFNKYFDIYELSDYSVFMKTWFENSNHFKRWLLTTYYIKKFHNKGYLCYILQDCHLYSNQELISAAILSIFTLEQPEEYLKERATILKFAQKNKILLSTDIDDKLRRKLEVLSIEKGYETVLKYISGFSKCEKELLIKWSANNCIAINRLISLFPRLYFYMENSRGIINPQSQWILNYIDAYKQAKLSNQYTSKIKSYIEKYNANAVSFNIWYNQFSTVRTVLSSRHDIDIYYWIDGLGIDWIPFILHLIDENKDENIFVNEVIIARSLLPTTTENNKVELSKLTEDSLSKKGDLDSFAHKCTPYPGYIIEEMRIVESAIKDIINEHAGKRIAIVSDHGLSYLSQLRPGYNIGGIKTDHSGRCASKLSETLTQDDKYIILDDKNIICALRHESLGAKVPEGQGCHGGCTPEEVLVPIIIISSQRQLSEYSISLIDNEISGNNPILIFQIKGVNSLEIPKLIYNKIGYNLNCLGGNKYKTDKLNLQQGIEEVEVRIGTYSQKFKIKINLGAEEEDLFDL